jgi:hypothetical protein
MKGKSKPRTPPDLMNELLGSLQEEVPLPGQRLPGPVKSSESIVQYSNGSTKQYTDKSTSRLIDLSARQQIIKIETRKRDGTELTRKTHYLSPDQVCLLKEYAFMTGQGESEVVRQALSEFFERHGDKVWTSK